MRETKCLCGNHAQLQFKNEIGRVKDRVVTIKNVPIYFCSVCKEGYMRGPDSLKFAERVKRAVDLGAEELEFQEREGEGNGV